MHCLDNRYGRQQFIQSFFLLDSIMQLRPLVHRRRYELRGRTAGRAIPLKRSAQTPYHPRYRVLSAQNARSPSRYQLKMARLTTRRKKVIAQGRDHKVKAAVNAMIQLAKGTIPIARNSKGNPLAADVDEDAHLTHMAYIAHDDKPVAAVFFYFNHCFKAIHFAFVVTHKDYQQKGLSVLLHSLCILYAASRGIQRATSEPVTLSSQKLFGKLGFKPYKKPFTYKAATCTQPLNGLRVFAPTNLTASLNSDCGGHYFTYVSPKFNEKYLDQMVTMAGKTLNTQKIRLPMRNMFDARKPGVLLLNPSMQSAAVEQEQKRSLSSPKNFPHREVKAAEMVKKFGFRYGDLGLPSPRKARK